MLQRIDVGRVLALVCHGERHGIVDLVVSHVDSIDGRKVQNRILLGELAQVNLFALSKDIVDRKLGLCARHLVDSAVGGDRGAGCLERVLALDKLDARAVRSDIFDLVDLLSVDRLALYAHRHTRSAVIGVPPFSLYAHHERMLGMRRLILFLLLDMLLIQVIRQPTAPANNDYRRAGDSDHDAFLGLLAGGGRTHRCRCNRRVGYGHSLCPVKRSPASRAKPSPISKLSTTIRTNHINLQQTWNHPSNSTVKRYPQPKLRNNELC